MARSHHSCVQSFPALAPLDSEAHSARFKTLEIKPFRRTKHFQHIIDSVQ